MPNVDISDELWSKLNEFKKIVEEVLDQGPISTDDEYVELVVSQGLEKMIRDLLPSEESVLTQDVINMFNENPQYMSQHILDNLSRGKETKSIDKIKEKWLPYG